MPGYVIHLSCAKRALEMLPEMNAQEQNAFFLGNMIADMCRDKHYTHFWNDVTYDKLVRRPDLDWFLQKYGDALQEPYVRGYYAHLLLDYNFLDLYWDRHFRFYNAQKQPEVLYDAVTFVEVLEQQQMYDRQEFFSKRWYYGDYDRMNAYFANRYNVMFPNLEFNAKEWERIRRITEIDWDYAPEAMERTKAQLSQSVAIAEPGIIPQLQIFVLPELEQLVEVTAKKVAEI